MITDEVHILPTKKTPEVILNPEGFIKIKGRAIDESRAGVPEQIVKWIDAYLLDPAESTEVIIALEFLNSFYTIILTANTILRFTPTQNNTNHIQLDFLKLTIDSMFFNNLRLQNFTYN